MQETQHCAACGRFTPNTSFPWVSSPLLLSFFPAQDVSPRHPQQKQGNVTHTRVQPTKGVKESLGYQCVFDNRGMRLVTYEKK